MFLLGSTILINAFLRSAHLKRVAHYREFSVARCSLPQVLSSAKSCEMIVRRPRLAINYSSIPPALPGVKRVSELNILGVRMSDKLVFTPHINQITTAVVQSTYALRVLRAHGQCGPRLWEVARATAVSKLTYACSTWWGFADSSATSRIQAVMNKLARLGFLSGYVCFAQICQELDINLFLKSCQMSTMCCTNCFSPSGIPHTLCALGPMIANYRSLAPPWGKTLLFACYTRSCSI